MSLLLSLWSSPSSVYINYKKYSESVTRYGPHFVGRSRTTMFTKRKKNVWSTEKSIDRPAVTPSILMDL